MAQKFSLVPQIVNKCIAAKISEITHCPLLPTYGLKKNHVKHNCPFPFKMIHQEKSHIAVLVAFSYTFRRTIVPP